MTANSKFTKRFQAMEQATPEGLDKKSRQELEELWQKIKRK
jgi:uncharacterized protein YabN with tetrapyrrole methylase and pyrophosphatase domain